jgi:hypothetical protein
MTLGSSQDLGRIIDRPKLRFPRPGCFMNRSRSVCEGDRPSERQIHGDLARRLSPVATQLSHQGLVIGKQHRAVLQQGSMLPKLGRANDLASPDDHFASHRLGETGASPESSDSRWIRGEESGGAEAADRVGKHAMNGTVRFAERDVSAQLGD